jgi:hypothetical protein
VTHTVSKVRAETRVLLSMSVVFIFIFIYLFSFNCSWVDTRWLQYSTHLDTNSTQNTENGTYITMKIWEVRAVPRLCELYPGICLTTEEKARKNLS